IAAKAAQWQRCRSARGEDAFRVPSQTQLGRYYVVTPSSCDCPDFQRNELALADADTEHACKHILAVRLHRELARAQQYLSPSAPSRSRAHLRLLPSTEPG